jgi:hypothetical protein
VNERAGGDFPHKCAQIRKELGQIAACSCVGVGGCESVWAAGWRAATIIIYNTKEEGPEVFLCTERKREGERGRQEESTIYVYSSGFVGERW